MTPTYHVVLGSQAVPSDLEMKGCIADLMLNIGELSSL